jgi:ribose transport system permease protein
VSENAETGFTEALKRRIDPPVAIAFACVIAMLLLGSLYSRSFLSPEYLLQQLKVASFLGVIATGTMIVILLGQIDLSIPWVVAVGGMMSTAATGWGPVGEALAIPFGVACGVALGLVNGFGVAYLRIPSMIITLAVNAVAQGLMVVHTGGFSPQDASSPAMRTLATGEFLFGLPNALLVWAVVGAAAIFLLNRTTFGRAVYGIGNRERAAYLSGIDTQRVVLIAFALAGGLSAFGGVLLAGYASKAAQAMGDAYLLPRPPSCLAARRSSAAAAVISAPSPASFSSRFCSRFYPWCRCRTPAGRSSTELSLSRCSCSMDVRAGCGRRAPPDSLRGCVRSGTRQLSCRIHHP